MQDQPSEQPISISEFIRYFLKHWIVSAVLLVVATAIGFTYTAIETPLYKSSAQLTVLGSGNQTQAGITRAVILGNYVALVKSSKVIDPVSSHTGLGTFDIISDLTVTNPTGTETIQIEYSSPSQYSARTTAEQIVDSFRTQLGEVYSIKADDVIVLTSPTDAIAPYNVHYAQNVLMGAGAGLALALIIAFIRFDHYKTKNPAMKNDAPPLTSAEKRNIHKREVSARQAELEARNIEAKARRIEAETRIAQAKADQLAAAVADAEQRAAIAVAEAKTKAVAVHQKKIELESNYEEEIIKEKALTEKKQAELDRERLVELEKVNTERAIIEAKTQLTIAKAIADRRTRTAGSPISLDKTGTSTFKETQTDVAPEFPAE